MNHGFCNANDFDEGDTKDDIVLKNNVDEENEAKDVGGNVDDDEQEDEDEDWCWRNMRQ